MSNLKQVEVAGVPVTAATREQVLNEIENRLQKDLKTFIITPYSEFIYSALMKNEIRDLLKKSNLSLADGIGVIFAYDFLNKKFSNTGFYGKIFEAKIQMFFTLTRILLNPKSLYKVIPEKIVGANFFWDLLSLANSKNQSVFFLGARGETPKKVSEIVKSKFPNLKIAGFANTGPKDLETIDIINTTKPDILFVAYGPFAQERFIYENIKLPFKVGIGVGGTFDYIAKNKLAPPNFLRIIGLEWAFRLVTQRGRLKRIFNATFGLIRALIRYKVYESMPFRRNAVAVIIRNKEILICRRKPAFSSQTGIIFKDYWQFPQGGMENDESETEAGIREAEEETGLKNLKLIKLSGKSHSYHWHNGRRSLIFPLVNKYQFKGQKQFIVYLSFEGQDSEIKLDNREFVEWKWVNFEKLRSSIHQERLGLLDVIESELEGVLKQVEIDKAN